MSLAKVSLAKVSLAEVSLAHVQESRRGKGQRHALASAWDAVASRKSLHSTKTASKWDFLKRCFPSLSRPDKLSSDLNK